MREYTIYDGCCDRSVRDRTLRKNYLIVCNKKSLSASNRLIPCVRHNLSARDQLIMCIRQRLSVRRGMVVSDQTVGKEIPIEVDSGVNVETPAAIIAKQIYTSINLMKQDICTLTLPSTGVGTTTQI